MNLWLRMLWYLLTAATRKPVRPLDPTSLGMIVLPNDLDINGHVNNGRYFTYCDIARVDMARRTGILAMARKHKAMPVVGDSMARFRRDLKLFDRFEIQSRVLGWDERWVYMEHRVMQHGRVCVLIVVRGGFKAKTGLLRPTDMAEALGLQKASPKLPTWVVGWSRHLDAASQALREEEDLHRLR